MRVVQKSSVADSQSPAEINHGVCQIPEARQPRLVSSKPKRAGTPAYRSEVYSRLGEDGNLEFGFQGCNSEDAMHHLMALSKLIGSLSEIVSDRGDDLRDARGRLVLFNGPRDIP